MRVTSASPGIILSSSDYNDLVLALGIAEWRRDPNAAFLARELRRASICHPDDLPDDVVCLNCRVIYRVSGEAGVNARLLVHRHHFLCPSSELPVDTPLGTALIGLRKHESVAFIDEEGLEREVMVEGIGLRVLEPPDPSHWVSLRL